MKPAHLLAVLFGLAAALLDLAVVTGFRGSYHVPLMLLLGLACGQLALLAFWCATGYRTWLWRLMVAIAAAAIFSRLLGQRTAGTPAEWFLLLCLFVGCLALALRFALRNRPHSGVHDPGNTHPGQSRRHPHLRFSLGGLLSLMTAVGLIFGLGRHFAVPANHAIEVAIYGFWLIVIALTGFWTLLSLRPLAWRFILLVAICLLAGPLMARAEHFADAWFFTMMACIEAIVICLGMTIVQAPATAAPLLRVVSERAHERERPTA